NFDALVDFRTDASSVDEIIRCFDSVCASYRVEERRLKAYPRDWLDGDFTPGLCLVSTVRRKRTLSRAQFDEHWRTSHAPLALAHHVGMWDYRQALVADPAAELDGIARLGFPSVQAFETGLFDSKAGRHALSTDMQDFIDPERTAIALLREIV